MSSDRKDYTGSLEGDKNEISETVHFHSDLDKEGCSSKMHIILSAGMWKNVINIIRSKTEIAFLDQL